MAKVLHFPVNMLSGVVSVGEDGIERLTVRTTRFAVPHRLWDEEGGVWVLDSHPQMGNVVVNNTAVYRREK